MGKVKRRRDEEIRRASRVIFESEAGAVSAPQINGKLRSFALHVPDAVNECSGIVVFGKRIRSLVFSTDVATIRNVDADAVWSVYPYTPQQIIAEALIHAADIPVFVGVGGGLTQGKRVVHLASFAEMQGAAGVIVNAPTDNSVVRRLVDTVDIPVIVTTVSAKGVGDRLRSGAAKGVPNTTDHCHRRSDGRKRAKHRRCRRKRHCLDASDARRSVQGNHGGI